MDEVVHWAACLGVGGLAALLMVGNWILLLGTARTGKPTSLVFPFVCGPVCAAACWLSPSAFLQRWFWVPLVADFTLLVAVGIMTPRSGSLSSEDEGANPRDRGA